MTADDPSTLGAEIEKLRAQLEEANQPLLNRSPPGGDWRIIPFGTPMTLQELHKCQAEEWG